MEFTLTNPFRKSYCKESELIHQSTQYKIASMTMTEIIRNSLKSIQILCNRLERRNTVKIECDLLWVVIAVCCNTRTQDAPYIKSVTLHFFHFCSVFSYAVACPNDIQVYILCLASYFSFFFCKKMTLQIFVIARINQPNRLTYRIVVLVFSFFITSVQGFDT